MKKKINIIKAFIIACIFLYSCEDFLEHIPKDQLTTQTAFATYESTKNYAWQFYSVFEGYSMERSDAEKHGDLGSDVRKNAESEWIWQKIIVPASSSDYNAPYSRIRACNIMLENIDNSNMSDDEIKHWKSVAYFFKAYNYIDLINKYGDITWVENNLKDDDQETLFGPRTPRDEVAQKILDLLIYAEENIKPDGDGPNTVNVHVVRALISRFGLREGTWRKYHGLTNSDNYLNTCVSASEKLFLDFPDIMPYYIDVFASESLAGKEGIILYKQYERGEITHVMSTYTGSGGGRWDMTKKAADMYLMRDGQTRWTSPLFDGDQSPYDEFRNRDLRMYLTTCPPYEVISPGNSIMYEHTGNPLHAEYFPIMDSISHGLRTLPWRSWISYPVEKMPHFFDNNYGKGWSVSLTGYPMWKFFASYNLNVSSRDYNDAPIFRIEEVMLNYAEAKKELGGFNQTICDNTINRLRARGGIAPLDISNVPDDPTRDPDVDPVMWEIRRERAIELMGENFRFDDLRRWKKMDYATERKLGRWINAADENYRVPILNNAESGYVSYLKQPPTPFPDYMYLYPIPSNQIVLTDGVIEQNPGWENN